METTLPRPNANVTPANDGESATETARPQGSAPAHFPVDDYRRLAETDRQQQQQQQQQEASYMAPGQTQTLGVKADDASSLLRHSVDLPRYSDVQGPPEYHPSGTAEKSAADEPKSSSNHSSLLSDEKRRLALQDVEDAIDRAYAATPQLENQRSVFATTPSSLSAAERGKQKEQELSRIMDQIERSHGQRLGEQTYVVDNARREKKDLVKRESYYADLMAKNEQGRMGDQDAEPVPHPSDMLRLTEFIRDPKQPQQQQQHQ